MNRLADKIAFITGAAMGLGHQSALRMAEEGARIFLTDIQAEPLEQTAARLRDAGHDVRTKVQDVAREEDWQAAVQACQDAFGGLDVLVNNAGVALSKSVEDTSLEEWRWLNSINTEGVFLGIKYGIAAMKAGGRRGSIINLSSIEGIIGDPNLIAYNASKGAVRIMTKSAALHCARQGYGIRVNSLHPGYIWTPMVEDYVEASGHAEETRQAIAKLHPLGHLGEPDDIAWGVVYLASDESKFMTGAELVIDGGYTAQ